MKKLKYLALVTVFFAMSQLGLWINLYNEKNHGYEYSSYGYSFFPILSIPGELIVCSFAGLSERNVHAWSLGGLIASTTNGFLYAFIVMAVYRLIKKIKHAACAITIFLCISGLIVYLRFFPKSRFDLSLGVDFGSRVFAQNIGSPDASMPVYLSDWPHTFSRPAYLGDIGWSQQSDEFYLSVDGSIIVCTSKRYGSMELNTAAYDTRTHKLITPHTQNLSPQMCNDYIFNLVSQRGGRSLQNLVPPDIKSHVVR